MSTVSEEEHSDAKDDFEAEEQERQYKQRMQAQHNKFATLSSMYGTGTHSRKIGLIGKSLIISMFLSWIFCIVLLVMSYLPFSKGMFNFLVDFRW